MENIVFGRNPVIEVLKSGREIEKLLMQKNSEGSAKKIEAMAKDLRVPIQFVEKTVLDKYLGDTESGSGHQGVVAIVALAKYYEVEDLLEIAKAKGEAPFLILLDGIEDPHNLGAIIRSADGAGAHGVIIPKRRAVGITETVAKASAGAVEYVPTAKVTNLVQTVEQLKAAGLWVAACDMNGSLYHQTNLTGPIALVIGGEGQGISRLLREKCDYVVSIPMAGKISSLNASNAAAILMYEIGRQRAGGK